MHYSHWENFFRSRIPNCALHQSANTRYKSIGIGIWKKIKNISFAGCEIAVACMATKSDFYFKKNVLELGGSDTFIVLNDANIEKALK